MRTERFNRAYDALVKAFFEGTLKPGDCMACAVGNICLAGGMPKGRPMDHDAANPLTYTNSSWKNYFFTGSTQNFFEPDDVPGLEQRLKDVTGYSLGELAQIEYAFETNAFGRSLEGQYAGLAAVVDVLLKLDNITPEDHYKNKFREHPQLIY